jgi:hypothetical protein
VHDCMLIYSQSMRNNLFVLLLLLFLEGVTEKDFLLVKCSQVYALMSFLSLIFPESSIYFNSIREV